MQPFAYHRAASPHEAISLISSAAPGARFIAGATTLYDLMKLNVERPTSVIDIMGLDELRGINTSAENSWYSERSRRWLTSRLTSVWSANTRPCRNRCGKQRRNSFETWPPSAVICCSERGAAISEAVNRTRATSVIPAAAALQSKESIADMPCSAAARNASQCIRATGRSRLPRSTPRSTRFRHGENGRFRWSNSISSLDRRHSTKIFGSRRTDIAHSRSGGPDRARVHVSQNSRSRIICIRVDVCRRCSRARR